MAGPLRHYQEPQRFAWCPIKNATITPLMLRKTLTILSLLGLVLSAGLWGVSHYGLAYYRVSVSYEATATRITRFFCVNGLIGIIHKHYAGMLPDPDVSPEGFNGWQAGADCAPRFRHHWIPSWVTHEFIEPSRGIEKEEWNIFTMPIYLLVMVAGAYPVYLLTPWHRRRKRKKLGLCIKCGYDLRGSKDRCPECGTQFGKLRV